MAGVGVDAQVHVVPAAAHQVGERGHLGGVLPAHRVALPTGPPVGTDPEGAWCAQADGIQAVLDDEIQAGRVVQDPHLGSLPLGLLIDRIYTADVFLHTWDLARATGQDERLDQQMCADLLAGMQPIEELLRTSGQYGPRVPVPDDADVQTRLLGFIGRDPLGSC